MADTTGRATIRHTVVYRLKCCAGSTEDADFSKAADSLASLSGVEKFERLRHIGDYDKKGSRFVRRGNLRTRASMAMIVLLALAAPGISQAAAPSSVDCVSAVEGYSTNTVLLDLLIDPAARAVLDKDAPQFQAKAPPIIRNPVPPSIADILTPRLLSPWGLFTSDELNRLDADLAVVKVTPAASAARCARYDVTPPNLPSKLPHPALLIFEKINGFRDGPSVDAARAALKAMSTRAGWTLVFTENGAAFNSKDLQRFDAVVWNNVSGDVLTLTQRQAFQNYIAGGGGFAGFHGSAGDPVYLWDWYADTLIGARFLGHPMSPQFQMARIVVNDDGNAIGHDLGDGWSMTDEWYSFKASPRPKGVHVIATLDENTYSPVEGGTDLRMGDHPIAWTRCIGNGRSFYTAIGHLPESYAEVHTLTLLERGISWAAGLGKTLCRAGQEIQR